MYHDPERPMLERERRVSCQCASCGGNIYAGELALAGGTGRIHENKSCVLRFIRDNWFEVREYGLFDALGLVEEVAP